MADVPLLLDTCAVLWVANDDQISLEARSAIESALEADEPVFVSPITAWEIGLLSSRGRIKLPMTPARWFDRLLQAPGLRLAEMAPHVLVASSWLPGTPPCDPADRIIVATAREADYCVVTRDRLLLDYAEQGLCRALAC